MEQETRAAVPYYAYESVQAAAERTTRRLIIALVIAVLLIFVSNAIWLYAWMQYDYTSDSTTTETITVDGQDGAANYATRGGSIINGTYNSQESNPTYPYTLAEGDAGDP